MAFNFLGTATKFAEIDCGDSGLLSTKMLPASIELATKIVKGMQQYARENPTQAVNPPQLQFDEDQRQITFAGNFGYRQVKNLAGVVENKSSLDLTGYTDWVTPTTGVFAGIDNPIDAFVMLVDHVTYIAAQLEPNALYNSPVGFYTLDDNRTNNDYNITINTILQAKISATGGTELTAVNWAEIVDYQNNLV
jgi:hypothetical protein